MLNFHEILIPLEEGENLEQKGKLHAEILILAYCNSINYLQIIQNYDRSVRRLPDLFLGALFLQGALFLELVLGLCPASQWETTTRSRESRLSIGEELKRKSMRHVNK